MWPLGHGDSVHPSGEVNVRNRSNLFFGAWSLALPSQSVCAVNGLDKAYISTVPLHLALPCMTARKDWRKKKFVDAKPCVCTFKYKKDRSNHSIYWSSYHSTHPCGKKDFLKMSSLGIFNRQRARGPHLWTCCLQSFIIQPGSPEEKVDSCPYLKSNEICFLVSLYSFNH